MAHKYKNTKQTYKHKTRHAKHKTDILNTKQTYKTQHRYTKTLQICKTQNKYVKHNTQSQITTQTCKTQHKQMKTQHRYPKTQHTQAEGEIGYQHSLLLTSDICGRFLLFGPLHHFEWYFSLSLFLLFQVFTLFQTDFVSCEFKIWRSGATLLLNLVFYCVCLLCKIS